MNAETPAAPAAKSKKVVSANPADRYSNAGPSPDPWARCALIEYGGDRSYAWTVRERVIHTPAAETGRTEQPQSNR